MPVNMWRANSGVVCTIYAFLLSSLVVEAIDTEPILFGPLWLSTDYNVSQSGREVSGHIILSYISPANMNIRWLTEKRYEGAINGLREYTLVFPAPIENFPMYTTSRVTQDIGGTANMGTFSMEWTTEWQYPHYVDLDCRKPDGSLYHHTRVNLVNGVIPTWGYDRSHLNLITVFRSFPPRMHYVVGQNGPLQPALEVLIPNYNDLNRVMVACWRFRYDRNARKVFVSTAEEGVYSSDDVVVTITKSPSTDAGLFVTARMTIFASTENDEYIYTCELDYQNAHVKATTDVLLSTSNTTLPEGWDSIRMWVHAFDTSDGSKYNVEEGQPTAISCERVSAIAGDIQITRDGAAVEINPEDIEGYSRGGLHYQLARYIIPSMSFLEGGTYTCGSTNGQRQSSLTLNPVVFASGW